MSSPLTPKLFENWLHSLEHQYGEHKCAALACNLIHRSIIENISKLRPQDIIDIRYVIDAFDDSYAGESLRKTQLQWLEKYHQETDVDVNFSAECQTLLAAHHLIKVMLNLPVRGDIPAWARSLMYTMGATRCDPIAFMRDAEFFLGHLED